MTMQVAATNQRQKIPAIWLVEFEGITDDELAWITANGATAELRAYAGWELEYRESFGIEVGYDEASNEIKRRRTR